jgi:queuine tRNA-ribosyltransferase
MTPERSIEIQGLLGRHPDAARRMRRHCRRSEGNRARHAIVAALGRALQDGVRRPAGQGDVRHRPGRRQSAPARREAQALAAMDFKGYAVGGLAVGEPQEVMLDMLDDHHVRNAGAEKPRYLMGVGTPTTSSKSVARGIDMFDCVMPTRAGRHGLAYTRRRQGQSAQRPPRRRSAPARRESDCPAAAIIRAPTCIT